MPRPLSAGQQKHVDAAKLRRAGVLQVWLELGPSRTLDQARKLAFDKWGQLSQSTMMAWSAKYKWADEATKYDEVHKTDVIDRVNEILNVEKMDVGATLDFLLKKCLKAMADGAITCRDAGDAQKVTQAAEKLVRMFEQIKDPESARRKYLDVTVSVKSAEERTPAVAARDAARLIEDRVRARLPAATIIDIPSEEVKPAPVPQPTQPEPASASDDTTAKSPSAGAAAQPVQQSARPASMNVHALAREAGKQGKTFAQCLSERSAKK